MEKQQPILIDENDPSVGRILVVDSDPFARISCRAQLCGGEFIVFTEEDREKAYERLAREKFDLIIADIRFPDVQGGLTFLQDAKFIQPRVDVVVTAERPSIWHAREAIRLGALKYVEKPFIPEFTMNVARMAFDKGGWVVRKTHIDQFRDYLTPSPEMDNPAIYYKNGSWARHLDGDLWEVGYDMKYWLPSGRHKNEAWAKDFNEGVGQAEHSRKSWFPHEQSLSLKLSQGLSALAAGEPYARVGSDSGNVYELQAPITGTVMEINVEAHDIMVSRVPEDIGADWLLWLARIHVKEEYCRILDGKKGSAARTYAHA